MSEEEKQAIKTVKQYKKCFIFETVHEETGERLNDYSNAVDIVVNLINKQQKEIEELQKYMKTNLIPKSTINLLYISKDKIRELIKEKAKTDTYNFKTVAVKDIEKILEE